MDTGKVRIGKREYKTVALRVSEFRERCPPEDGWAILTDIIERNEEHVVVRAQIVKYQTGVVATGLAEERRDSSQINKTSALENCETSAIGRALAAFGLGGSEYASANEVQNAIHQQETPKLSREDEKLIANAKADIAKATSTADLDAMAAVFKTYPINAKKELGPSWRTRYAELEKQEKDSEHSGSDQAADQG